MRNTYVKLISFITFALLLFCISAAASAETVDSGECGENLTWTLTDDGALTISGEGEMYDYSSTVGLEAPWNKYASVIKSAVVDDGVTNIGEYAFYNCESIESASLPDTLECIDFGAFYMCRRLARIDIPTSVTKIDAAFFSCGSLSEVHITDLSSWCSITFTDYNRSNPVSGSANLYLNGDLIERLEIPSEVSVIKNYAFTGLMSLKELILPEGLKKIGDYAFYNCNGLKSVTFPDGFQEVGVWAFGSCSFLEAVDFGRSTPVVGGSAFNGCVRMKYVDTVSFENWMGIQFKGMYSFPTYLGGTLRFSGEEASTVTFPKDVTVIPDFILMNQKSLKEVIFEGDVTYIGEQSFAGSGIEKITLPASLENVRSNAFRSCEALSGVYISDLYGFCSINFYDRYSNPLYYAHDLYLNGELVRDLRFPEGIAVVKNSLFSGAESIVEVTFPGSVKEIASCAFENCTSLTKVTFAKGLERINSNAFRSCPALKTIDFADSSPFICNYAFSLCAGIEVIDSQSFETWTEIKYESDAANPFSKQTALYFGGEPVTSVTFPESFTVIPDYLFTGLKSLKEVVFEGKVTRIGVSSFSGTGIEEIELPSSLKTIGAGAFSACPLKTISIPASVTAVGAGAFGSCSELEGVYITDLSAWCAIDFADYASNPLYPERDLYVNGELVTVLNVPSDVKTVKQYAFSRCSALEEVVLPEGLVSIGQYAFERCPNLKKVSFPSSLESIGDWAFDWCEALEETVFGGCSPEIEAHVFNGCTGLKAVRIADLYSWCSTGFGNVWANPLFNGAQLYVNGEKITELHIPEGITSIPAYSFCYFSSLTSLYLPSSVKTIENSAFKGCGQLESVIFSKGLAEIGSYAFCDCQSLESVSLPEGLRTVGIMAFMACSSLKSVDFPEDLYAIKRAAFNECSSLKSIRIPKNVGELGAGAFAQCTSLEEVIIPESLTAIPESFFYGCTGLSTITIPQSVDCISSYAFKNCTSLENVVFPDGIENIDQEAFRGCSQLKNVKLKAQYIGESAFRDCSGLESFTLKDGSKRVGDYAFSNCAVLKNVYLADSVTMLGEYVFYADAALESVRISDLIHTVPKCFFSGCESLTEIIRPSNLKSINQGAFDNCKALKAVVLPDGFDGKIDQYAFNCCESLESVYFGSVSMISYAAFQGCASLQEAVLPNTLTRLEGRAFYQCKALKRVVIPVSLTAIETDAFLCCESLESVVLPNSVKTVESSAFSYCKSLKTVIFGSGVETIGNGAFRECSSLEKIVFPTSLKVIGRAAFLDCSSLKSVRFTGGNVSTFAFSRCPLLTEFSFSEDPDIEMTSIFAWTGITKTCLPLVSDDDRINASFSGCSQLVTAALPEGIKTITGELFTDCTSLETVYLPGGVESIYYIAFNHCDNLKDVYFGGTKEQWDAISFDGSSNQPLLDANIHFEHVHKLSVQSETEPTCVSGSIIYECSECSATYMKVLPAVKEHSFSDPVSLISPTCISDGVSQSVCSVCGFGVLDVIPALTHSFGPWTAVDEDTHERTCWNAGCITEKHHHSWNEGETVEQAVCTGTAQIRYTCERCGYEKITGGQGGEHQWDDGVVTKQPTVSSEGEKTFTCKLCGLTRTELLPKAPPPEPVSFGGLAEHKDGFLIVAGNTSFDDLSAATKGAVLAYYTASYSGKGYLGTGMLMQLDNEDVTVVVRGDYDGDGEVTAADARMALRAAVNLEKPNEYQKKAVMLTGDAVTAADARLILRAAVRLEKIG